MGSSRFLRTTALEAEGGWYLLGGTGRRVTGGLAELPSASGDTLRQAETPEVSPNQVPGAGPHRRLGVGQAELHLQDVLGAQPQVAAQQGNEDRVVPVILQGRRTLVGGSALPSSPLLRGQVPSPPAHPSL